MHKAVIHLMRIGIVIKWFHRKVCSGMLDEVIFGSLNLLACITETELDKISVLYYSTIISRNM